MKNLVIVESPAKAKTIEKFLGPLYRVRASYGHVRDLPKGEFGIDVRNNFQPKYVIPLKIRKRVNDLKKEASQYDFIILATDPDREGEAIAWHLSEIINLPNEKIKRIVFYEITEEAIKRAIKNPQEIDKNLVNAQQARRVLDRIVGYKLSPFLWKKIKSGLSAGRVQSVALRLIVEREKEIQAFKPQEYWVIEALLQKIPNSKRQIPDEYQTSNLKPQTEFSALLIKKDGQKIPKLGIKSRKEANKIIADLKDTEYKVSKITKKEIRRFPRPPFITSSLQQEAFNKFKFSPRKTMLLAQQLYEGIELENKKRVGLITYMRTDSFHLAEEAIRETRNYIKKKFGDGYLPEKARSYRNKAQNIQEAHEAIRPSCIEKEPEAIKPYLTPEQFKLYSLIWQRTVACQMKEAIFDNINCEITAKNYLFKARGLKLKFDGFLRIYKFLKTEEKLLPPLVENEILNLKKIEAQQKFTEPPKRYTEGSLVKTLEENGVGRPSTYAPTISTLLERGYVVREDRYLKPQKIGFIVNNLLKENFPEIIDINFTAKMEKNLDKIAQGKKEWVPVIADFYYPFIKHLQKKYREIARIKLPERITDELCEKCGKRMVIKHGRFGEFLACSGFPQCKNTKPLIKELNVLCPQCGNKIVERKTKKGKTFYGCSAYPSCKFALWNKPLEEKCPRCQGIMIKKNNSAECIKCGYTKSLSKN